MRKFILFIWRQNMMVVIYITKTLIKITSIYIVFFVGLHRLSALIIFYLLSYLVL